MRKFDIELNEEMIVEEMSRRGLECEITPVVKNGTSLTGITYMCDGGIHPTVYLEHFTNSEDFDTFDEMCDEMERLLRNSADNLPFYGDFNSFTDRDFVLDHVYVCIQRHCDKEEDLVTVPLKDFDDLDKYYRIRIQNTPDGTASFKLKKQLLESTGLTIEEIDEVAMKRLKEETEYESMFSILSKGGLLPDFMDEDSNPPMIVLSSKNKWQGASSILNYDVLEEICEKLGTTEIVIIPSSIHEVIIVPKTEDLTSLELVMMIKEVNSSELSQDEILSDHPYEWSLIA